MTNPASLSVDYQALRRAALEAMEQGISWPNFNKRMNIKALEEEESDLYYFPFAGLVDLADARRMPAPRFVHLLCNEVWQSVNEDANYADKRRFDENIFWKYTLLLYMVYQVSNPMSHR